MYCDCIFLKRLCYIALITITPFSVILGQTTNKEKAKQLEGLATHTSGVLSDISEEIRAMRSGPVTQHVTISDDGVLTLSRWFYCRPSDTGKMVKATSVKRFALADLHNTATHHCDINRHSNTITLFDKECCWSLGFPSTADTEQAYSLLESLITSVPAIPPTSPSSCAAAAARAGYKYLVVASRCEEVSETMRLLSMPEPSRRLLCWLTKRNPQEMEALFHESRNRLPLFLFDITALDGGSFFTQSIPGNTTFLPCSIGSDMMQSVYSDEKDEFEAFLKSSPFVGICFESMPDFLSPVAILCKACDEHKIRKTARSLEMPIKEAHWYFTTVLDDMNGVPLGTTSSWVTGINNNSYDILRYCLFHKELTQTLFAYMLYPEFPSLKNLLKMKSRYRKDCTIGEMVCRTSHALDRQAEKLPEWHVRVLRIALVTHEFGGPFGDDTEIGYNSWPLSLAVAEKMGLTKQEKKALQALIEDPPVVAVQKAEKKKKEKEDPLFLSFVQESRTASEIGISLQEWLQIKACFYEILSIQGKPPGRRQSVAQTIKCLQKRYSSILPFGVPRGTLFCHGPLKTRDMYSSYIWEVRDPLHRDGLFLKRWREKFERMIVEGKKVSGKGHFWDWLNKELQDKPGFPNDYLKDSERDACRAWFEGGALVAPQLPSLDEVELMFVVDDWGRMYLGLKNDGERPQDRRMNHASLLGGRPVASAGKLLFKNGSVVGITDHSGHYRSGPDEMAVALSVLEKMGVSLGQVKE
jgi:hypothetical protein